MPDREKYPLPGHIRDAVVNRAQLADAFNTTEPTIDRMRKDGMPVKEEGSNGRSYQFQLSDCYAWKMAREADRHAEEKQVADSVRQMRLELLGGDHNDSAEQLLSPKQRKELYEAEHAYNKLASLRGEMVSRAEVEDLLNKVFDLVRKSVNGMPDRLSRDAGLSGRQAEQAVAIADDILSDLHRTLTDFADVADTGAEHDAEILEAAE
ncbi:DUF1441 family protein [Roseibium polysiphoniae]|uniref:DUF1441 family protein n=1 Tax=Roseibium polysiphoniae TaxID=2571221 RepID=A0ABR9C6B0_9HYPH|nr:DUF1441 family protein [Roseibium polysiphoniae]MBD8875426.1 DUF1441 family protein [Roseibium polysiphoniae]